MSIFSRIADFIDDVRERVVEVRDSIFGRESADYRSEDAQDRQEDAEDKAVEIENTFNEPTFDMPIYDEPSPEVSPIWEYDRDDFSYGDSDGGDYDGKEYIEVDYTILLNDGTEIHGRIKWYGEYEELDEGIFAMNGDIDSEDVAAITY